jgi:hypothetical protein
MRSLPNSLVTFFLFTPGQNIKNKTISKGEIKGIVSLDEGYQKILQQDKAFTLFSASFTCKHD